MTDSEDLGTSAAASIESVLAEFDSKKDLLTEFCVKTKNLIEECLQDADIRYQSIQARVKTRKKLEGKYLDPKKNYKRLNQITDQAALRVITYYEDEVDRVAEAIKGEFDIDPQNSVDKRDTEPDKFGYYALNFVCKHVDRRSTAVEYKRFAGIWCEIQITSILRHAWSEIEHPWYDLKGAFPPNIKRRFARMAALLEIAESEFLDLRKIQENYRRSVDVQVETKVPDIPVDIVSLRSFVEQEPLVMEIDNSIASLLEFSLSEELLDSAIELRAKAANLAGLTTVQEVRDAIKKYQVGIVEYVDRCREFWRTGPSPSTTLQRGVCIFHLGIMLLASRGEDQLLDGMKALGLYMASTWNITGQAVVAKEILAKYPQ